MCSPNLSQTTSLGNRVGEYKKIDVQFMALEPIGNIAITVILFLLVFIFDFYLKRLAFLYDRKQLTVADYSVKLMGLPNASIYEDDKF